MWIIYFLLTVIAISFQVVHRILYFLVKGVNMFLPFFWIKRRKYGVVFANGGSGSAVITVDFKVETVDIRLDEHFHHPPSCAHKKPDQVSFEVLSANRLESKIQISWNLTHPRLIKYIFMG